ncbi:hypothetical protein FPV67DRAFT_1448046 [Lyophyllum atratum]|nr:hypothetical protein FPV67DRAFT_1448046 [Lyophyllum atratum]
MAGLQVTATAPYSPALPEETLLSTKMEGFIKRRSGPLACEGHSVSIGYERDGGEYKDLAALPLGTLLTGLGGIIRYRCYRELGQFFTFEMSIRKDHRLVTSGPYSIVRHPGYSGVVLCIVGIVIWHAGSGSWARECGPFMTRIGQIAAVTYLALVSLITTGLLARMSREDEVLSETFGEEWTDWVERVPHRLIPGLY